MNEDTNYIKIITKLSEIHVAFPDMRFGQVLQVAIDNYKLGKNTDLNDLSSKELLKCLDEFHVVSKQKRRRNRGYKK